MKRKMALAAMLGLCHAAMAHGAWVYAEVESTNGAARPSAFEARLAQGQSGYAAATQALAVAQAALPAATAALDSMMTTGRIYRAEAARMLEAANGRAWLEFGTNGAVYVVSVTNTDSIYVSATRGDGYVGPALGTVWPGPPHIADWNANVLEWTNAAPIRIMCPIGSPTYDVGFYMDNPDLSDYWTGETDGLPVDINSVPTGLLTLDWVPATNVYIIATEPTVITISQNAVDAHDEDGDAHPTLARQSSLAGYVATNHAGNVSVSGTVAATAFSGDGSALTGLQKSYMYMGATNYLALSIGTVTGYQTSEAYGWTVNQTTGIATNASAGVYLISGSFVPTGATAVKYIVVQTNGVDSMLSTADYAAQRGSSVTGILRLPANTAVSLYSYPSTTGGMYERHITAVQIQ